MARCSEWCENGDCVPGTERCACAHALNKAEMAKAAASAAARSAADIEADRMLAVALTLAFVRWLEVPEEEQRFALLLLAYERDRMPNPQNVHRVAALTRAADLLRAAGGTP